MRWPEVEEGSRQPNVQSSRSQNVRNNFRLWRCVVGCAITVAAIIANAPDLANAADNESAKVTAKERSSDVAGVRLTTGVGTGVERSYTAQVFDRSGRVISGATLDIGGLGTDPDSRIPTINMRADKSDPTQYSATLRYPSDGDWVLVVRVHTPTQAVDLFTESISGTGIKAVHGHGSLSPSRRAVLKADSTFFQRYAPGGSVGVSDELIETSVGQTPQHSDNSISASRLQTDHEFDPQTVLIAALHTVGAMAWILAVLGLVLANRMRSGAARTEITGFISRHYRLLAGGGLTMAIVTGIPMVLSGSAGLAHPTSLVQSNLGTAYLAVFAFKVVLVAGSLATTWRMGRALPTVTQLSQHLRLASVGAKANDDVSTTRRDGARVYRLAETNVVIGAAILGCVVLLGQLHHLLH
jgi:hypothetical protein